VKRLRGGWCIDDFYKKECNEIFQYSYFIEHICCSCPNTLKCNFSFIYNQNHNFSQILRLCLIKEITITENDGTETQMSIFKHENGGLFGIDISFLDSIDDELSEFYN